MRSPITLYLAYLVNCQILKIFVQSVRWRRKRQPIPIFLPGESHGQRNLEGYSRWGCKESDIAEATYDIQSVKWYLLNFYYFSYYVSSNIFIYPTYFIFLLSLCSYILSIFLLDCLSFTYQFIGFLLHSSPLYLHACMLSHFGHVQLFGTLWTVARQAPLSMGILQARILKWVAMPSFRGSFRLRDGNSWLMNLQPIYDLSLTS